MPAKTLEKLPSEAVFSYRMGFLELFRDLHFPVSAVSESLLASYERPSSLRCEAIIPCRVIVIPFLADFDEIPGVVGRANRRAFDSGVQAQPLKRFGVSAAYCLLLEDNTSIAICGSISWGIMIVIIIAI